MERARAQSLLHPLLVLGFAFLVVMCGGSTTDSGTPGSGATAGMAGNMTVGGPACTTIADCSVPPTSCENGVVTYYSNARCTDGVCRFDVQKLQYGNGCNQGTTTSGGFTSTTAGVGIGGTTTSGGFTMGGNTGDTAGLAGVSGTTTSGGFGNIGGTTTSGGFGNFGGTTTAGGFPMGGFDGNGSGAMSGEAGAK